MTEQIKSAIEWCEEFEIAHNLKDGEKNNFRYAINSLKAWSEVLEELEELEEIKDDDTLYIHIRVRDAIDIINQKLAEIEEEEKNMVFSCFNGTRNCDYCGSCHSEFQSRTSDEKRRIYNQALEDFMSALRDETSEEWKQSDNWYTFAYLIKNKLMK